MFVRALTAFLKSDIGTLMINCVLVGLFTIWSSYQAYQRGVADTKAAYEQVEKTQIKGQLDRLGRDIMAATIVSQATISKLADYQTEGEKTTHELQQSLAKNRHSRRDCRYPADSLLKLSEARTRATKAATAGISGTMSGVTATPAKSQ
ncbi:hypothetical protein [Aggregatibacter actinomycetemcomitans]|uniref:hypothetical protein n=1 Tax=Aggregatibacter actinomycetemcomitans TaxID=714 RepID=UPI00023FFCA6|nr:hypothetical protein [Aggregatibacter actinomycetemcomitans]EHK90576.1 hypothetical protein RHAA1_05218 [Aggregatibacter actinomycetemcomitans RhAA1]KNE77627.1 hypothetical protein RHAA2_05295 [Aggregatibacter actinomycetemcomitans RhAA1]MBN6080063.1 hypothetical protein [Aggregatibacter actinomycetemcomitans]